MFRRVEGWSLLSATDSPQQKLLLKELLRIDCLTLSDMCLSFLFVNQRRLVSDVKKGSFSKNRQYIIEKWRIPLGDECLYNVFEYSKQSAQTKINRKFIANAIDTKYRIVFTHQVAIKWQPQCNAWFQ